MPQLRHRAHDRLREYWDSLRNGRAFPSENDIDTDAIADIWGHCFLISIDEVTQRIGYRYSYLGHGLAEAYGYETTDPDVAMRLLATGNVSIVRKFDEVREKGTPLIDEAEFVNARGLHVRYRSCLLPLGYDGKKVSHIIGSMSWRVY